MLFINKFHISDQIYFPAHHIPRPLVFIDRLLGGKFEIMIHYFKFSLEFFLKLRIPKNSSFIKIMKRLFMVS